MLCLDPYKSTSIRWRFLSVSRSSPVLFLQRHPHTLSPPGRSYADPCLRTTLLTTTPKNITVKIDTFNFDLEKPEVKMAAVSAPQAPTSLTPPSSSHGGQQSWNYAVPSQSEVSIRKLGHPFTRFEHMLTNNLSRIPKSWQNTASLLQLTRTVVPWATKHPVQICHNEDPITTRRVPQKVDIWHPLE